VEKPTDKKYEITITKETEFLHIKVQGIRNLETVKELFKEILMTRFRLQASKMIIDIRRMTRKGKASKRNVIPKETFPELHGLGIEKVAIIDHSENIESFHFLMNIASQSDYQIIFTDSLPEALTWLLE
jgi:hypothetical protein